MRASLDRLLAFEVGICRRLALTMASKQSETTRHEVEVARETAAAFGRAFTSGEIDAFLALLAPDVAYEAPSVMQSTVVTLNGHDEVRRYLQQTASDYEELRVESSEVRDLGGGRFLLVGSWHAKPRHSPTPFGTPVGAVLDIRDGRSTGCGRSSTSSWRSTQPAATDAGAAPQTPGPGEATLMWIGDARRAGV